MVIWTMNTVYAQSNAVIYEALDCKKEWNYAVVKANLDKLAKPKNDSGALVYSLNTPFQYGKAELNTFILNPTNLTGQFSNYIVYKKAFALISPTNTLKKSKRENSETHAYWNGWSQNNKDYIVRVEDSEIDSKTNIICGWFDFS